MNYKIIAVGNPLRRDDAIALAVAEKIKKIKPKKMNCDIIITYQTPENCISPRDKVVLIDAVDFGGRVGEVKLFLPKEFKSFQQSTHNMSSILMKLSSEVIIIGIQPHNTDYGEGFSEEIYKEMNSIVRKVTELLDSFCH